MIKPLFPLNVVQGKLVPVHEDVCENGGIAPLILNLGTRWKWVVSFTPHLIYPQGT